MLCALTSSASEVLQSALSLILRAVTVDGRGLDSLVGQHVLEVIGVSLRLDEDERESLALGEDLEQTIHLLALASAGVLDALRDEVCGGSHASHREEDVVSQEILRQSLNLLGECRTEHERLSVARHVQILHDLTNLRLEAHVQHAISLVEHEESDVRQGNTTALGEVHKTTRGSNEQI